MSIRTVAITSAKGGGGKTSLSHALALGAAWNEVLAHLFYTDTGEAIQTQGRPYNYYSANTKAKLAEEVATIANDDGILIIDSGGNRHDFDAFIAEFIELVLIPVTPDSEDIKRALSHAQHMKQAGANNIKFVVNKMPSLKASARVKADRHINKLPDALILCTIPIRSAIGDLRDDDIADFKTPSTPVNNLSRALYDSVILELEK